MKLGDIKIEALKLMFATEGEDPDAADVLNMAGSERYGSYLAAMNGSINRCFADLENKGVLWPSKAYEIKEEDPGTEGYVNLRETIKDYLRFDRLSYHSSGRYYPKLPNEPEGDLLPLPRFDPKREGYTVFYRPTLERISFDTDHASELPLSDRIAAWIPYWIVGELYREDEPSLAAEMMNRYTTKIAELLDAPDERQGSVKSVYSMEGM